MADRAQTFDFGDPAPGPGMLGRGRLWLAGLHPGEAEFDRRGFHRTAQTPRLEAIGKTFILGYNHALSGRNCHDHPAARDTGAGFFWEGAAMGAGMRDALSIGGQRHRGLVRAASRLQPYLVAVGTGWAMARLPWRRKRLLQALPPLLAPLALDGWGFHDAYFRPSRITTGAPNALVRAFGAVGASHWDQGAGRALWFICGADTRLLTQELGRRDTRRRGDLASGVGLAACYAGGATPQELKALAQNLPELAPYLAQGAGFALEARALAGLATPELDAAATALTGLDPAALRVRVQSSLSDTLDSADPDLAAGIARYRTWRRRLVDSFSPGEPVS